MMLRRTVLESVLIQSVSVGVSSRTMSAKYSNLAKSRITVKSAIVLNSDLYRGDLRR